jgi:hypothetical protein
MDTATLQRKIPVHETTWELFRLSRPVYGHRLRPDGQTDHNYPIVYVLLAGDAVLESNEYGEVVGFGALARPEEASKGGGPHPPRPGRTAMEKLGFRVSLFEEHIIDMSPSQEG